MASAGGCPARIGSSRTPRGPCPPTSSTVSRWVAGRFAPESLIDLHADLFDHHPRLSGVDPHDYEGYYPALTEARRKAMSDILDSGGVPDLFTLGRTAVLPQAVGATAAEVWGDRLADEILPLLGSEGADGLIAHGYAGAQIHADGLDWVERQLRQRAAIWSVPQQAALLLAAPRPSLPLLSIVGQRLQEVRDVFWRRVHPLLAEPEARSAMAREFIERRRPWAAVAALVTLLPSAAQGTVQLDVPLVEAALFHAGTGPSEDVRQAGSLIWEAEELLNYLERMGSDVQTRARLEFLMLPLPQFKRPARALYEALGAQPALFAEIVSYVYPAEGEASDEETTPERRAIRMAGYSALRSWNTPPGVRPDGTVDAGHLRAWVIEARRLLDASGRATTGDSVIGSVLAHVPADSDGLWPAASVRDLIEDLASDALESGLSTGKINSRGFVSWSPESGGDRDRALATQARGWAESVPADQWRTAALLRQLTAHHGEWARREDDRTQEFGDGGP